MRYGGKVALLASVVLVLPTCGGGSDPSEPRSSNENRAAEERIDYGKDYGNQCLEVEKGRVFKVDAGKKNPKDHRAAVSWYPMNTKAPAGTFITLEITNPGLLRHDFTSDDLDCQTKTLDKGESVTVSFEVPPGETDFVCSLHEAFMAGNIIGTK